MRSKRLHPKFRISISAPMLERLDDLAALEHVPRAEVIRRLLDKALDVTSPPVRRGRPLPPGPDSEEKKMSDFRAGLVAAEEDIPF